jgi:hypothetical protein
MPVFNPINIINYAPPPPTTLIFKDESGEDAIIINREDFARDWVHHWDENNNDYEDCVDNAWCYLVGSDWLDGNNGEAYINIVYEEDEDKDMKAKIGRMVDEAVAFVENEYR